MRSTRRWSGGRLRNLVRLPRLDNAAISAVLRSPAHRVLSGIVVLVRYPGRRSGRLYTHPVQYAEHEGRLVVAAFGSGRKQWWRNVLAAPRVEILHRGRWLVTTAEKIDAGSELAGLYSAKFQSVRRQLKEGGVFMALSPER